MWACEVIGEGTLFKRPYASKAIEKGNALKRQGLHVAIKRFEGGNWVYDAEQTAKLQDFTGYHRYKTSEPHQLALRALAQVSRLLSRQADYAPDEIAAFIDIVARVIILLDIQEDELNEALERAEE